MDISTSKEGLVPQTTFHPFPRLPLELRTAIFCLALQPLPAGRVIDVHIEIDPAAPFDRHEHDSRGRFPTRSNFARFSDPAMHDTPGLSLLWASAESRLVAKSYYDLTFLDTVSSQSASARSPEVAQDVPVKVPKFSNLGIIFSPARDIIYLRSRFGSSAFSYARSSELMLSNIKILAIDSYLWRHYLISKQLFEGWKEDAPFLTGLEKLFIVLDDDPSMSFSSVARLMGNEDDVESLRVEVEKKIAGLENMKEGVEVELVYRDELSATLV